MAHPHDNQDEMGATASQSPVKVRRWWQRNSDAVATNDPVEPPAPRFVCRTCGTSGPFYVARQVVNWNEINAPYRQPDGTLTYRELNVYLPGNPGPPLAYSCGGCCARADTLEELVLEPALTSPTAPVGSEKGV